MFDDGVTLRLAEDRFLVSCSSGHTDSVVTRLELWRQDRFDPRRVVIHDTTAQWATLTLTGPRARDLVAALGLGVAARRRRACPTWPSPRARSTARQCRIARVSFTGDRSYELSVPARRARALRARIVEKLPAVRRRPARNSRG